MTEPRSVRLTQQHRNNMADAVIAEWEKQNPTPAATDQVAYLELVASEFKKHQCHKRTKRMLEKLEADDLRHVHTEASVHVRILNKQGEERRVDTAHFPLSLAKRFGLSFIPGQTSVMRTNLKQEDCQPEDEWSDENDRPRVKCVMFAEHRYPMVQINDDSKPMVQMKEARKARKKWQDERDQLYRETRDLLEQFNTTKQLREGWSDMVPYLPPHIADPSQAVKLPVLATSRLSERLGIKE